MTFTAKKPCADCHKQNQKIAVATLAERPELDADDVAPEGCRTQVAREKWFTSLADEAARTARDVLVLEKGTKGKPADMSPKAVNAAAKMFDVAIKAEARAAELGGTRERRRRVRRLEALGHDILNGQKRVAGGSN